MAALMRFADRGGGSAASDDDDDERLNIFDDEDEPNAFMRLSKKRAADGSPEKGSPAESMESENEDMPPADEQRHVIKSLAGNKNAKGSDAARWEDRAAKESVEAQILKGCRCGCVHKYGLVMLEKVLEERELYAKFTQSERRAHVKSYLFDHKCAARELGFRMTWFDDDNEACIVGFSVRTGLTTNWRAPPFFMCRFSRASFATRSAFSDRRCFAQRSARVLR